MPGLAVPGGASACGLAVSGGVASCGLAVSGGASACGLAVSGGVASCGLAVSGGASACGLAVSGGVASCGSAVSGGASAWGRCLRGAAGRPPVRDRGRKRFAVADIPLPGTAADKRRATLRRGAASLTETAGRAPFEKHGHRAGEGAP
ncbi:DUF6380 family protein [Streptomyces djakartensis]|nr:DUF6380 family protein [Streptomyces djakartensis]